MLNHLKANNRNWAQRKVAADAGFFRRLEDQQAPNTYGSAAPTAAYPQTRSSISIQVNCLSIATSPTWHRRRTPITCRSSSSLLTSFKVKHIIVVGHYGCGGIAAAVDGQRRGLVDHWLHPIREVYADNREALEAIPDLRARLNRLCELNVIRQVHNVASDVFVQDAWMRGQDLLVHGWVYSLSNGLVTDLNVTVDKSMDPSLSH